VVASFLRSFLVSLILVLQLSSSTLNSFSSFSKFLFAVKILAIFCYKLLLASSRWCKINTKSFLAWDYLSLLNCSCEEVSTCQSLRVWQRL
jgi:hypothetical protein